MKSCGHTSTSAHSFLCMLSPVKSGSLHEFTPQGYCQNVRGENQNVSKSLYSLDTVNCVFMEERLCDIVWEQLCQMWESCPCSEVDTRSALIYFFTFDFHRLGCCPLLPQVGATEVLLKVAQGQTIKCWKRCSRGKTWLLGRLILSKITMWLIAGCHVQQVTSSTRCSLQLISNCIVSTDR